MGVQGSSLISPTPEIGFTLWLNHNCARCRPRTSVRIVGRGQDEPLESSMRESIGHVQLWIRAASALLIGLNVDT